MDMESDRKVATEALNKSMSENQPLVAETPREKSGWCSLPLTIKAWSLLLVHGGACLAVALSITLAVDGYKAIDKASTLRYYNHKFVLRVSDITTLVSAALVLVKLLLSLCSTVVISACGQYLRRMQSTPRQRIRRMIRWGFLPAIPHNWQELLVSAALIVFLAQTVISPILTGALDWNTSSVPGDIVVSVNSTAPNADFTLWYWYNADYMGFPFDKRRFFKAAAGYASLAWADPATISPQGSSLTGNGCRRVVSNDGLPRNSTLHNAVIPCINIHSISWYKTADEISADQRNLTLDSTRLSLLGDAPSTYYVPGQAIVFDPSHIRDNAHITTDLLPSASGFSGSNTVSLMVKRQLSTHQPCQNALSSAFGDVNSLGHYLLPDVGDDHKWQNCYFVGQVNFTAGVTTSPESTYISSRVIEDQTPLDQVIFETETWVQEALWLLPDLMTTIALMNSSQQPTWENVDGFVESLLRQAYLAAWNMYHDSFDQTQVPLYSATPQLPRLEAKVSYVRVFVWLAICFLATVSWAALLTLLVQETDLQLPEEQERDGRVEEVQNVSMDVFEILTDPNAN